ncbi:MAG: tetratricopeptide repeat protein [Lentisphaeria bacterium]
MNKLLFFSFLLPSCLLLFLNSCTSLWQQNPDTIDEIQVRQTTAETAETAGHYKKAAKIYGQLSKLYTEKANIAFLLAKQAKCQLLAGKIHVAKENYEALIKGYPLYMSYEKTVDELRQLADCFEFGKGTFLGIHDKQTATAIYELIVRETPAIHVSLKDRLKLAELLLEIDNPEEAANVYQAILKKDPEQNDVRLKFALLLERFSRRGDGDGRKLRAAVREAHTFLAKTPAQHPGRAQAEQLLRNAQETQADRLLIQARFYLKRRHRRPDAAKRYLLDITREFPGTRAAQDAKDILRADFNLN